MEAYQRLKKPPGRPVLRTTKYHQLPSLYHLSFKPALGHANYQTKLEKKEPTSADQACSEPPQAELRPSRAKMTEFETQLTIISHRTTDLHPQ